MDLPAYTPHVDTFVGCLYVCTFVVGCIGNVLAVGYFRTKTADLPTLLYLLTAYNDVLLCALNLCSGLSLLNSRRGMLFDNSVFCTIWDILHFVSVKLSVMLVLILCLSRTYAVLYPFKSIHVRAHSKYRMSVFLCGFCVLVLVIDQLQRALGYGVSTYVQHDVYCWMTSSNHSTVYRSRDLLSANHSTVSREVTSTDSLIYFYMFGVGLLALPVIPVSVACVVTVCKVRTSLHRVGSNQNGVSLKKHATVTIIIFTSAYVVFNIPLFLNYLVWIVSICVDMQVYARIYEQDRFMYLYSWNVSDVLCVSLNSSVNPLIYVWRIRGFRTWLRTRLCFWAKPRRRLISKSTETILSIQMIKS